MVQIDDGFDRAWRRVGLALDRTGFTVEDRDRAQGTYFVRYVTPNADKKEPGFFGKLFSFGSSKTDAPLKYRIMVKSQGEASTVAVLERQRRARDIGQRAAHRPGHRRRPEVSARTADAALPQPRQRQHRQRHAGRSDAAAAARRRAC